MRSSCIWTVPTASITGNTEATGVPFNKFSVEGELDLLTAYPHGELNGVINTPLPASLEHIIAAIEPVEFSIDSNPDAVRLQMTTSARTQKNIAYVLSFNSQLDLAASDTDRQMLFDWSAKTSPAEDSNANLFRSG